LEFSATAVLDLSMVEQNAMHDWKIKHLPMPDFYAACPDIPKRFTNLDAGLARKYMYKVERCPPLMRKACFI
jgi:hypothetical protein